MFSSPRKARTFVPHLQWRSSRLPFFRLAQVRAAALRLVRSLDNRVLVSGVLHRRCLREGRITRSSLPR